MGGEREPGLKMSQKLAQLKDEEPMKLLNGALKRRDVMLGALAGVGLWVTHLLPIPEFRHKPALADWHFADFNALLGERFRLYNHAGLLGLLQLIDVKNSTFPAARTNNAHQECFSLAFHAPKGHAFTQDTYTLVHPKLGHFALFIVPTQPVEHADRYIAIINRI
jgi:hypothetical protein